MARGVLDVTLVGDAFDMARRIYAESMPDFMPDVCTLSVPGTPVASRGQFVEGAPTTIASVPCSYQPLSAYERQAGGAVVGGADYALELPVIWLGAYLSVPATSTITVAGRGVIPARIFSVVGPLSSSTDMKQRVSATLRE